MLDALSSHSQSPIISKHLLPPRRCVSVGGPAASLWPYHKNGGRASDLEGSKHCGQTTSKFKKFTPPKFNIAPPCRERPDQMSQAATAVLATERSTHTADTVSGWTRALGTVVGTVVDWSGAPSGALSVVSWRAADVFFILRHWETIWGYQLI